MKALQSRHLTPAQGREKKKILGCWPVALPPANTPNPDYEKALGKPPPIIASFVKLRYCFNRVIQGFLKV
jgi:hypothetical protein